MHGPDLIHVLGIARQQVLIKLDRTDAFEPVPELVVNL